VAVLVSRHGEAARHRTFGFHPALAKLCQSTGRPAEPSSIEGFSPTVEMPEIAEAQAQLEGLA
jgi:hypothetical protein